MLPPQLNQLITHFSRLPGIGPRQAARFVFYLLRNRDDVIALKNALDAVHASVHLCSNCFLPAVAYASAGRPAFNNRSEPPQTDLLTAQEQLCSICTNQKRNKNTICVIEKETDALNFEKAGHFKGRYYVLGGFINPLEKESLPYRRVDYFLKKISEQTEPTELILALSPRREGDFTSLYIEEQLKPLRARGLKIKTTRLGRGLSSGAELEYADNETLRTALEGRK